MKPAIIFFVLLLSTNLFAQTTTYSKEEENMIQYVNMGLAYSLKYDSPERVKPVIDSCWNFLDRYPKSFAKPNVFTYLLEMTAIISDDLKVINPLIDSVLYYDSLPTTKLRIGELLIERNLDIEKGREFVFQAVPNLTVPLHLYKSHLILAKTDMQLGKYTSAELNLKKAIAIDSTRRDALYEYNNFLIMRETPQQAKVIQNKINRLNEKARDRFINNASFSPNVNKNISDISLYDMDSNLVTLHNLKGKIVVINRFNFWCKLCVYEFPALQRLKREFPLVEFVFINSGPGEDPAELREKYFPKKEFSFLKNEIVLFATLDYYNKIYGSIVPHTYVVDRNGNIRFDYFGYNAEIENTLRKNLSELVAE